MNSSALFSTNDRNVAAAEAFTNRQGQWDLVAALITEHLRRTADPAFDVEDLEAPADQHPGVPQGRGHR
ncbi:hypothetical protein [Streptomyces sp. NA02950]|uniref:hypothetical protein n=1 Tax=Streptomyces sp. NA02950 TaxID=2742137 RepID=UPI0034CF2698